MDTMGMEVKSPVVCRNTNSLRPEADIKWFDSGIAFEAFQMIYLIRLKGH